MRRRPIGLLALAAVAAGTSAAAAQEGVVLRSWSVEPAVEAVFPGPAGGVVVVTGPGRRGHRVTAFRPNGVRLWTRLRTPACGNCDYGPHPIRLQPDGTYGPIGPVGDDAWAYDRAGRQRPACAGAVLRDGGCIAGGLTTGGHPGSPVLSLRRHGDVVWRLERGDVHRLTPDTVPPIAVTDLTGRAYAAFDNAFDAASGRLLPGLLLSARAGTGALAARVDGPREALAGLRAGVVVRDDDGLAALGRSGAEAWRRDLPDIGHVRPASVAFDAPRNALVVGIAGGSPRVIALSASTGRPLFAPPARDRARLLSVGAGGGIYVAADASPRRGLVELSPAGRPVWRQPAAARVVAAGEIAHGRVALAVHRAGAPRAGVVVVRAPR